MGALLSGFFCLPPSCPRLSVKGWSSLACLLPWPWQSVAPTSIFQPPGPDKTRRACARDATRQEWLFKKQVPASLINFFLWKKQAGLRYYYLNRTHHNSGAQEKGLVELEEDDARSTGCLLPLCSKTFLQNVLSKTTAATALCSTSNCKRFIRKVQLKTTEAMC